MTDQPTRPTADSVASTFKLLTLLVLCLLWLGCSRSGSGDTTSRLVITGSSTVAPLVTEIARRFEAENPSIRIDVQTGGSSRGIADVRNGVADLGMASRAPASDERDLPTFTIARDGVGMIVHADNPIAGLTDNQVRSIFTDAIHDWAEVGGEAAPITVVNKAEGRATLKVFQDYFKLTGTEIRADVIIGHNEQGIKTVAGNPHAIGYVSIGVAETDIEHGVPIRLLSIGGIAASTSTVAEGSFPIARPLNLVSNGPPSGLAERFVAYCLSEHVHDLIEAQRFVPSRG